MMMMFIGTETVTTCLCAFVLFSTTPLHSNSRDRIQSGRVEYIKHSFPCSSPPYPLFSPSHLLVISVSLSQIDQEIAQLRMGVTTQDTHDEAGEEEPMDQGLESAIRHFEACLSLDPRRLPCFVQLGLFLPRQRKDELARYWPAIKSVPGAAEAVATKFRESQQQALLDALHRLQSGS